MKRKAFLKMMKADGWEFDGPGAEHDMYILLEKSVCFSVPRHTEVSVGIVRQYKAIMKGLGK